MNDKLTLLMAKQDLKVAIDRAAELGAYAEMRWGADHVTAMAGLAMFIAMSKASGVPEEATQGMMLAVLHLFEGVLDGE